MKNAVAFVTVLIGALVLTGCATTVNIDDNAKVYSMPEITGASTIVIADFSDNRPDKTKVGTVCALTINTKQPVNILLTDKIALKLRESGFNVKKTEAGTLKEGVATTLAAKGGNAYLSGGLGNFLFASFDAMMEKAKGTVTFYVKIYDKTGNMVFDKSYSAYAENWIGLTGASGCKKMVELSLESSVNELFKDKDFQDALEKIKT